MKKFLLTFIIALTAMCAQAQVYLGGSVGLAVFSSGNQDSEVGFRLLPEVGYNFNNTWSVGAVVGYEQGNFSMLGNQLSYTKNTSAFQFSPYATWSFFRTNRVTLFLDMGLGFTTGEVQNVSFTALNIGVKPGVSVGLTDHLKIKLTAGFLGYESIDPEGDFNGVHAFGFDVNGNNIQLGLFYTF